MQYKKSVIGITLSVAAVLLIATLLQFSGLMSINPENATLLSVENDKNERAPRAAGSPTASSSSSPTIPQTPGSENQYSPTHLATFDVLTEISKRIAVEQYDEAENEIDALVTKLDSQSDEQKRELLVFLMDYVQNNPFDPEAVTAFNQLWNTLSMSSELRLESSQLLGAHYVAAYEFSFAIEQFEGFIAQGGEPNSAQLRDLSHAHFQMHEYQQAIPYLLDYFDSSHAQDQPAARGAYSELFEAYYRLGDLDAAETVGKQLLEQFDDIQDWKDMQLFYEATDNAAALQTHMENARVHGFVSRDDAWIE
jgi:tetratricopeptide (TPR) repeat protein